MPRRVEVTVEDARLKLEATSISKLIDFLDSEADWTLPKGELSIAFITPERCCELHETFFSDDSITDVMTFPGDPDDNHAGDLAICPAFAVEQAPEYATTFAEELTLYLLHGWLHLVGFDDQSPEDMEQMRKAEKTLQEKVSQANFLLSVVWTEAETN
jgi:probable rRNA maturation factor